MTGNRPLASLRRPMSTSSPASATSRGAAPSGDAMVDPGVSAWFDSKKARSASITTDHPDGAPVDEAGEVAAAAGIAGAAGSFPDAKSSPQTSQKTSSGVRVAPQLGHTDPDDAALGVAGAGA